MGGIFEVGYMRLAVRHDHTRVPPYGDRLLTFAPRGWFLHQPSKQ